MLVRTKGLIPIGSRARIRCLSIGFQSARGVHAVQGGKLRSVFFGRKRSVGMLTCPGGQPRPPSVSPAVVNP